MSKTKCPRFGVVNEFDLIDEGYGPRFDLQNIDIHSRSVNSPAVFMAEFDTETGEPVRLLGCQGNVHDAPEDVNFNRDLHWVETELNRLAQEVEELKKKG